MNRTISCCLAFSISVLFSCTQPQSPGTQIDDLSTDAPYTMISATQILKSGTSAACDNGGVEIDTGFDANGNSELDSNEITETYILCNGDDSFSRLVVIEDESAGENCTFGGKKLTVGVDENFDEILSESEIDDTEYFCSFVPTLIEVSHESWGDNCDFGGDRIDVGVDLDASGDLQEAEIYKTEYVCSNQNLMVTSHLCRAGIDDDSGITNIVVEYRIDEYRNGEITVSGEIVQIGAAGLNKVSHWSPYITSHTDAWKSGLVTINFDFVAGSNNGSWLLEIDRGENYPPFIDPETTDILVSYSDEDLTGDTTLNWTPINFQDCKDAMVAP